MASQNQNDTDFLQSDNLSKKAVAQRMGVTSSTIVRWIDRLGFPKPYTLGGRTYFSAKEADEWLEAKKLNRGFNGIPPGRKKS